MAEVEPLLEEYPGGSLAVAIDNGPSCVVSGLAQEIDQLEERLKQRKVQTFVPGMDQRFDLNKLLK